MKQAIRGRDIASCISALDGFIFQNHPISHKKKKR